VNEAPRPAAALLRQARDQVGVSTERARRRRTPAVRVGAGAQIGGSEVGGPFMGGSMAASAGGGAVRYWCQRWRASACGLRVREHGPVRMGYSPAGGSAFRPPSLRPWPPRFVSGAVEWSGFLPAPLSAWVVAVEQPAPPSPRPAAAASIPLAIVDAMGDEWE